MRLKVRPEDVNALEMSDWLARLRDEVSAETGSDETELETVALPQQVTRPPVSTPTGVPATPGSRPSHGATTAAGREQTVRAVIGDELHVPIAWCEMGSCISHYTDPAALGEAGGLGLPAGLVQIHHVTCLVVGELDVPGQVGRDR